MNKNEPMYYKILDVLEEVKNTITLQEGGIQ